MRRLALSLSILVLLPWVGRAEEPRPSASPKPGLEEETLPEIEAKTFDANPTKKSRSGRVYMFQVNAADPKEPASLPRPGKILLLKTGEEPILAFRVLKQYPDRSLFAGSRVRKYPPHEALDFGTPYTAVEKLADINWIPYSKKDQELDRFDLKELESEMAPSQVSPYDPQLDAGSSPPPGDNPDKIRRKAKEPAVSDDEEDDSDDTDQEVEGLNPEEVRPIESDRNWLSFEVGMLRNEKPDGVDQYYTGAGFRYGFNMAQRLLFRRHKPQDSLTLEASLFYYSVQNYEVPSDSYSVVPFHGAIRYNLFLSQFFGMFGYVGFMKNNVLSSNNGSDVGLTNLASFQPAIGAGLLFQLGPKWYLRADLGYELIGAGLLIRF